MQRTRIKICGVSDVPTALVAAESGADAIGLVFVNRSPRQVYFKQARRIVEALPAFVDPVALFVDAPCDKIQRTVVQLGIGTVQLHGEEGPEQVRELVPLHVIKAMAFDSDDVTDRLEFWRAGHSHLAALLWDTPPPRGGQQPALPGGSGQSFDWHALAALKESDGLTGLPPLILAGGLNPDNVGRAIATVHPYAVDVSSGIESRPGVKDPYLIRAFVQAVREADALASR